MKLHPFSLTVLAIFAAVAVAGCSDGSNTSVAVERSLTVSDPGAADVVVVDTGVAEKATESENSTESAMTTRELTTRDVKTCEPTVNHVVINELMIDPVAVGDADGEWIELYNPTANPVDLQGWYIAEDGPGIHQIQGSLVIQAGGYLVLCRNDVEASNGGIGCAYKLTNFVLINATDSVLLLDPSATEIDRVVWGPGEGTAGPAGATIGLKHPYLDNAELLWPLNPADTASWEDSNFMVSSTTYGPGDKGTPGAKNDGYEEQNHPTCYDANVCTWDACTAGVCSNPRKPDCCLANADCNDGEICTQDLCDLNTLKCTNNEIANCCHDVSECDDENPCNADFCTSNRCVYSAYSIVPLCCWAPVDTNPTTGLPWASEVERAAWANAQCDDKKYCTPDYCDLGTNTCAAGEPMENCCNLNSDCNDDNACTYDMCWGHQCTYEKMQADCCVTAADCDDNDPCTTDTCFGSSCRHLWSTTDCCYDNQYCIDHADDGNPCTAERCLLEPLSGRFTCQHPYDANCTLELPYVERFDGVTALAEIGWTTRDYQTSSTAHWKLNTTDGDLGPDTHVAFTWDPLPTIVVKTVAITPQIDGTTAAEDRFNERLKKTTLQWRMSYRHSAPGQNIKLKVVASDNNDFINGAVVWSTTVADDIEYSLMSVTLPDAIKFSPTLKIGFLLDTAPGSTYMMNSWEIDDVKVAAGVSNYFIKAKAYRCPQDGVTPCNTGTGELVAESAVEGEMPSLMVSSCDWTRLYMCYYDQDASNMTWQTYGYPLSFLDAEPLDQPAFTGGAPDVGQGGFCDTLPGMVQFVCGVPAIAVDGYYYCGIDVKPACNEDYAGSYRMGLVSQDEYDSTGISPLHAPFESLTKFDLTILLEDGYIVWSPNGMTDPSAVAIKQAIKDSGRKAQIITDLSIVPDLTNYDGVFAVMGVKGRYSALTPMDAARLRLFLDGGGRVYLEGGDFFYTTAGIQASTVLHPYFKTEATSDGTMRLAGPIEGANFLYGASFNVSQTASVNAWIDKLQHVSEGGGREIVRNSDVADPFALAVSYEGDVESGVYRTIASSLPFGAFAYNGAMSTNQLMTMYLNFLENGYPPCTQVENCQDFEVCTTDYCNVGECANLPVTNCIPCENDKYRPDGSLSCGINQACDTSLGYCVDIPGYRFDADCQTDFGAAPVMASCAVNVAANGAITNSNFKIGVAHEYRGDVKLTVTSPAGTSAVLRNSSFADAKENIYETYDIGVDSFQPVTVFDGQGSVGTWTVTAEDTDPSFSNGTFEEWHLFAEMADVACSVPEDCPTSLCQTAECVDSACVFTPKGCDDGLTCTVDSCDPATGECINEVIQACGGPCVTHDDCFRNEVCLVADTEDRVCDPSADFDPGTGVTNCVCRTIEGQPYEYDWVSDLPSDIPDNDLTVGLTKVLHINATGYVSKVKVKVRTIHQAAGDLRAEICHEDVCVRLRDSKGGITPGFHDVYDWDPVIGPGQMLDFKRLPVAGDWTLHVWDGTAGMTGQLVYYTVYIVSAGCFRNSECDDGNLCTLDSCTNVSQGGVCVHSMKQCEPSDNPCMSNVCLPATGECTATPAANGDPCDDGAFCTEDDFCRDGACQAGTAMDCSYLDGTCTSGVCSEDLDQCTVVQAADSTPCEDGELCNGGDYCEAGVCMPGPELLCGCPSGLDSACLDDGNKCNGITWICNADKMCELADGPVICEDTGIECRTNVCDTYDGVCKMQNSLNYMPCEDGLFCSVQDYCLVGEDDVSVCMPGTARDCAVTDNDCSDGYCSSCVEGYCDEDANDCAEWNKENGTVCEFDGLGCSNDVCTDGLCGYSTMVDCTDTGDDCNEGICQNIGWGDFLCVRGAFPDGTVCTDEPNPCTEDLCMDGYCEHERLNNCNGPCGGDHPFDAGDDDCGFEDSCVGGIDGYPFGGCNPTCPDGLCYKATAAEGDLQINERVNGNGCQALMIPVTTGFDYVLNAEVKINLDHEAIGQLEIDVIDPQGARHRLWNNLGEENQGFANTFDLSFPIAYPGISTSGQPMCALKGEAMDGIWTVQVCDHSDGGSGTIHSASLYMKGSDDPTLNLGSRCETPIDLGNQDLNPAVNVDGTLACAINSITDSGCGGLEGPDRIYKFSLGAPKRVTVNLLPVAGQRLVLFLKDADGAGCAAGSLRCAETTDTEAAVVDVQLQPGDYFIGIDTNSGMFAYTPFRFELRLKTLVENGGDCTDAVLGEQDLDCVSVHCQNGFCCDGGDCCPSAAWEVPEDGMDPDALWFDPAWMETDLICNRVGEGIYSEDPICNDPDMTDPLNPINYCQGKRWDARCVNFECVKTEVPDDTACDDTVESDHCGYYYSMFCGDEGPLPPAVQIKPDCLTYCTSDTDCDPNAHCDPVVATDPDPDPSLHAMYCVEDLPNGAASNENSDCVSGHSQNGYCCSEGDCCPTDDEFGAGECPAIYTTPGSCDTVADPLTGDLVCEGHRKDPVCVDNKCGTVIVRDDCRCGGAIADNCGAFIPALCPVSAYSDPALCPGAGWLAPWDGGGTECLTSCLTNGVPDDSKCDDDARCDWDDDNPTNAICIPLVPNGGPCEEDIDCLNQQWLPGGIGHCQNDFCCDFGDCCNRNTDCPVVEPRSDYWAPPACDDWSTCQGTELLATCIDWQCGSEYSPEDSACVYDLGQISDDCGFYLPVYCNGDVDQIDPPCPTTCYDGDTKVELDSVCDPNAHCDPVGPTYSNAICMADLANDQPCDEDSDCTSEFCQVGYCCDVGGCCAGCRVTNATPSFSNAGYEGPVSTETGFMQFAPTVRAITRPATGGRTTGAYLGTFEGVTVVTSCWNRIMDQAETDIDCGGRVCNPCAAGNHCIYGTDCSSGTCVDGVCQ